MIYSSAIQSLLAGSLDLTSANLCEAIMVDTGTPVGSGINLKALTNLSQIPALRRASDAAAVTLTVSGRSATLNSIQFKNVKKQASHFVVYRKATGELLLRFYLSSANLRVTVPTLYAQTFWQETTAFTISDPGLYSKAVEDILKGRFNFNTASLKVAACGTGYAPSDAHQYRSSLTDVTEVQGLAVTLVNSVPTVVPPTFTALSGTTGSMVVYEDTGNPSTSRLVSIYRSGGLPFTGTTVTPQWPDGLFRLTGVDSGFVFP